MELFCYIPLALVNVNVPYESNFWLILLVN
jgi:hypothetical protein